MKTVIRQLNWAVHLRLDSRVYELLRVRLGQYLSLEYSASRLVEWLFVE
jgi:hypothetical protein